MSEQSSSNQGSQSVHTHQSNQARKQRIQKKKLIRKQKVKERKRQTYQSQESKPLTREQKKELQKQKNRIAAQVSRDNRKKYIKQLEQKIDELETELQQNLCHRCKESLVQPVNQDFFAAQNMVEEADQIFLRRSPSTDSLNSIGNYFLLLMITIAVVSFSGSAYINEGEKIQLKQNRILHPVVPYQQNLIDLQLKNTENQNGGLIEIGKNYEVQDSVYQNQKEQCLNDFLNTNKNGIKMNFSQFDDKSVILCKNPEVFPKIHKQSDNQGSLLGKQLTLFMSGPQVKQLQQSYGQSNNYYTLQGIYKMELQIKILEKVFNSNCLN